MAITPDLVPRMYEQSLKMRPMWIDDVWMFGLVTEKLKTQFIDGYFTVQDNREILRAVSNPGKELFFHVHSIDVFHNLWRRIASRKHSICSSSYDNQLDTLTKML